MRPVVSVLAFVLVCSLTKASSDDSADLHVLIKGIAYQNGEQYNYTHNDGVGQLPYNDLVTQELCNSTYEALSENREIRLGWVLCKVEYANEGEVLVHVWLDTRLMDKRKVDISSKCFTQSLKHYFEVDSFIRRGAHAESIYLGEVQDIKSSVARTHKNPQKRLRWKSVKIVGTIYQNGRPVEYYLPFYEPLNDTMCKNIFKAIKQDDKLVEAWIKCEVRSATGFEATMVVSFCKSVLRKREVDYSSSKFAESIKHYLDNYRPRRTKMEGYYFGRVNKVYGAMNIWVEGVSYQNGTVLPFVHLDGQSSFSPSDRFVDTLCSSNFMSFGSNPVIKSAWIDCMVKLVQKEKVLSDIWLDNDKLSEMGVTYESECFPIYLKYYLEQFGTGESEMYNDQLQYYGQVDLIYGHRKDDGI